MTEQANTDSFLNRYGNVLIITVAVVIIAAVVLWFMDRQEARKLELRRIEHRIDLMEEWAPPERNAQPANSPRGGGKVL